MTVYLTRRIAFADFLSRLAAGSVGGLDWGRFVEGHYADEVIEDVRRQTVKLAKGHHGGKEWSNAELQVLRFMETELRTAAVN